MHNILLNIKSFFRDEKIIFFIIILCVISSAFIINFSYGLYYNYNTKKTESELELKDLDPEISEDASLTKGDFRRFVENLDTESLNAMEVVYAASTLDEFANESSAGTLYMRYVIHDGKYGICEVTKESWEKSGMITSGRYISNGEEANGSDVAVVWGENENEWDETSEKLRNADGTITLFGKKYLVVGTYMAGGSTPIVPFLSIPDDIAVNSVGFSFERNITRAIYNDITDKAEEYLPGVLVFPELQFPDTDTINIYNNMMWISVFISILSVINFAMLYHFIIQKRQRSLAIMRICGCTSYKAVLMYFSECAIITLPSYLIGIVINIILTKKVMNRVFEYFEEAYSVNTYLLMFAAYIAVYIIILLIMIYSTVRKTIVEEWRT